MTEALMSTKAETLAEAPDKLRLMAAVCGPSDNVRWTLSAEQARKVAGILDAAEARARQEVVAEVRAAVATGQRVRAERLLAEAQTHVNRSLWLAAVGLAALLAAITVVLL